MTSTLADYLLLDTQVVIWMRRDPDRLPARVADAIRSAEKVAVSVISAWEYGAKRARRPGELPLSFSELLAGLAVVRLPLDWDCQRHAELLPDLHRDPFDRMLIAQALEGGWTLVTADRDIRRYPVPTLW